MGEIGRLSRNLKGHIWVSTLMRKLKQERLRKITKQVGLTSAYGPIWVSEQTLLLQDVN